VQDLAHWPALYLRITKASRSKSTIPTSVGGVGELWHLEHSNNVSFSRLQNSFSGLSPNEFPTAPFRRLSCVVYPDMCFNLDAPRQFPTLPRSRNLHEISFEQLDEAGSAGCRIFSLLVAWFSDANPELSQDEKNRTKLWWDTSVDDVFRRRTWFFGPNMVDFFTPPGMSLFGCPIPCIFFKEC